MRCLLRCDSLEQKIRIIDLLNTRYYISPLTLRGYDTEEDFIDYPYIEVDVGYNKVDLIQRELTKPTKILTEREFMGKYLPEIDLVSPYKSLSQKFRFIQ